MLFMLRAMMLTFPGIGLARHRAAPATACAVPRGSIVGAKLTLTRQALITCVMPGMQVSKARWKLRCQLCRQQHGACIQCAGSNSCFAAFHPLCARSAGLHMAAVDLSRLDSTVGNCNPSASSRSTSEVLKPLRWYRPTVSLWCF